MPHLLIVHSPYYDAINAELVRGAVSALQQAGASHDIIDVPGAFEIPAAIGFALETRKYDGYVALGCVIRGETSHYDYVCGESARALMELAITRSAAIGYGILTVENEAQAHVRANISTGDKGGEAARAALRMIALKEQFGMTA